jgi:hypothetical protein
MTPLDPAARRTVYHLMITVAVALAAGRLLSAERVYEPSLHRAEPGQYAGADVPRPAWPRTRPEPWPTFSSNDRSRWAAVRALVDEGTFVIGRRDRGVVLASAPAALAGGTPLELAVLLEVGYRARVGSDTGVVFEDGWQTVDKVLHPGRLEFYSTKPPLLTVLAAGEYWLLKKAFGWSIVEDRWAVIGTILVTFNILPFVVYLVLLGRLAEYFGSTDWGRFYVVAAGCFGTLVTPFLITFNNHTVAACAAAVALYLVVRIASGEGRPWRFALAGFLAGFTACNELPATAFAVGVFVYLLWREAGAEAGGPRYPVRTLLLFAPAALVPVAALVLSNDAELGQWRPAYAEFGGPWYQYEGSHWRVAPGEVKRGIDWAGRSEGKSAYAFHLLLGHHGVLSLTPITLLALAGMALGVRRLWARTPHPPALWDQLAAFTLLLSLVVIGFYVSKSDHYGGWSNGPRWLMWLTPLWLVTMLPAADRLAARRAGRALALALLAVSVLSMSYQVWNPWRHPWLYTLMEARGLIRY